eukprot:COSAG01_NODE_1433_length_10317_cov_590.337366_15_plen_163_part_00
MSKNRTRVGIGYDVHALVEGRDLIIGGVKLPFEKGLLGHSDADVLSHAISDALLGALALGDIGQHFPDNDAKYKNADSIVLLQQVHALIKEKGYEIGNIDTVIQAQRPKFQPYILEIRKSLAKALGLDLDQISVKATTTEKLGFVGQEAGMAAQAVVYVYAL